MKIGIFFAKVGPIAYFFGQVAIHGDLFGKDLLLLPKIFSRAVVPLRCAVGVLPRVPTAQRSATVVAGVEYQEPAKFVHLRSQ